MNAHPFHRRRFLAFGASLILIAAACSRREEPPPPPPAPPALQPAAANPPRAPDAAPPSPSAPAPDAPPPGANLDKVARDAAAFANMVDSLRQFSGQEIAANPATLDLATFLPGKSLADLFSFAQETHFKSPYATLQVLEHLWGQDLDIELRLKTARLLVELAANCGYDKDRALAHACIQWMTDIYADPAQAAKMSRQDRESWINDLRNLTVCLDGFTYPAEKGLADALRKSARTDLDLTYADTYEAYALMLTGRADHIPAIRRLFESIRARDFYGRYSARKESVDRWLSLDDAAFAAEIKDSAQLMIGVHENTLRLRHLLEPLSPAERIAEMLRQAEAASRKSPQKESP